MVKSYSKLYYVCECDNCRKVRTVEKSLIDKIYNGAQAVRSLGWSFSEDGKTVICSDCRRHNLKDKYRYK